MGWASSGDPLSNMQVCAQVTFTENLNNGHLINGHLVVHYLNGQTNDVIITII